MIGVAWRAGRATARRVIRAAGWTDLPGFDRLMRQAYGPSPRHGAALTVNAVVWRYRRGLESSAYIRLLSPLTHGPNGQRFRLALADATTIATAPIGDVVVVQRHVMPDRDAAMRLLDRVGRSGARLIVDCDDDLRRLDATRAEALELLMRQADQVWFSTAVLAEAYREISGGRALVVRNALDPRLWGSAPPPAVRKEPGLRLLYMGTRTHDADLATILPALDAFVAARPGTQLYLAGAAADPKQPFVRCLDLPSRTAEYPLFVRWLQRQGPFDLGIAPLEDRAFNAAKSDIKLLDYCALGLPALLADMPPYRDTARPDGIAALVSCTTDGWLSALLAFDPETASAARQQRLDYVWKERSIAAIAERQHALITGLAAR